MKLMGSPHRVLVFSHMYPRDYHAANGIFVHEQVKALRKSGLDVRVMSGEPFWINTFNPFKILILFRRYLRTNNLNWEMFEGVPVIRFPYCVSSYFLPFQTRALTYTHGAVKCLANLQSRFDFELVHAHTSYIDGSAGTKVAALYQVPLVITEHTGPFNLLTRTPYLKKKTRAAVNSAKHVIAVSQSLLSDVCSQLAMNNANKFSVIPNGVDPSHFKMGPFKSSERILALWVGHFVEVKRVDVLLRAMAAAIKIEARLFLRLVGTGELEKDLRLLAKKLGIESHVEFAGFADRDQLHIHYQQSHFLVISSDSETFGVVAIEALSSGRPVLTTNCGGPAETVCHKELGLVVEKSVDAIANGLVNMAGRVVRGEFVPEDISRMAEERFGFKRISAKLIEIYRQIMAPNSR